MAATTLYRKVGEQFCNANGYPLAGYRLYYYRTGTTTLQDTYSEQTGVITNANPITLDSAGRLPSAVFLGTAYDYAELLTDASDVPVSPWPFEGIPKAIAPFTGTTGFERLYQPWTTVAYGPQNLTANDYGNAYEYNCGGGNVVVNLPAASSIQEGTGYTFKKIDSTHNQVVVTPNGSNTIDGLNAPMYIGVRNMAVGITSDGANWQASIFAALPFMLAAQVQYISTSSSTLTIDMSKGWLVALTLNNTISTFNVTNWPADGTYGKLQLDITNSGSNLINAWPSGTVWYGGTAPVITASGRDTIIITSYNGGTNKRGFIACQNMS